MQKLISWSYKWLPIICGCHCRDDRSFHYKGQKFPVCARCTGMLTGVLLSVILIGFFKPPVAILFLLLTPLVIDGVLQKITRYESNNVLRFITGILFGYGIFSLFMISFAATVRLGFEFGLKLQNK